MREIAEREQLIGYVFPERLEAAEERDEGKIVEEDEQSEA